MVITDLLPVWRCSLTFAIYFTVSLIAVTITENLVGILPWYGKLGCGLLSSVFSLPMAAVLTRWQVKRIARRCIGTWVGPGLMIIDITERLPLPDGHGPVTVVDTIYPLYLIQVGPVITTDKFDTHDWLHEGF